VTRAIDRVHVVVPACDEAASIDRCLRSLAAAAAESTVDVRVLVVADSCTDDTAALARSLGAEVLPVALRNVGRARAAGCRRAPDRDGIWLAHTDADSTVPVDWLARQVEYAGAGVDVVAGPVQVDDWQDWPAGLRPRYERRYAGTEGHVHGCNLGIRASAYRRLGGFAPLPVGEDRALVDAARAAGLTVRYPLDLPVRTSGRRHARVAGGGLHAFLDELSRTA
jgi:glycosyltransferase involved in cell wall biosynthesis